MCAEMKLFSVITDISLDFFIPRDWPAFAPSATGRVMMICIWGREKFE